MADLRCSRGRRRGTVYGPCWRRSGLGVPLPRVRLREARTAIVSTVLAGPLVAISVPGGASTTRGGRGAPGVLGVYGARCANGGVSSRFWGRRSIAWASPTSCAPDWSDRRVSCAKCGIYCTAAGFLVDGQDSLPRVPPRARGGGLRVFPGRRVWRPHMRAQEITSRYGGYAGRPWRKDENRATRGERCLGPARHCLIANGASKPGDMRLEQRRRLALARCPQCGRPKGACSWTTASANLDPTAAQSAFASELTKLQPRPGSDD
jgi:hypothetical protein